MASTNTAIVRWTGKGDLEDLRSSVEFVLGEEEAEARVSRIGESLTVEGPEPLRLAALLGNLPGVSWVAAGLVARSYRELSSSARQLSRKYLKKGDGFVVYAEGTGGTVLSDISGIVTSAALDAVKGSRVSTGSSKVCFRAAFDGDRGVVGVQVRQGPGGAPTGSEEATCLVSGGVHSSVVAWEAVLQGFRVRLVHVMYSEESLRAVARLYSELSHRADPRGLTLEVIDGESVSEGLSRYASSSEKPVFAGFSSGSGGKCRLAKVLSPLYLMSEDGFATEFEGLGIKSFDAPEDWDRKAEGEAGARRFGRRRADVSAVMDGLK